MRAEITATQAFQKICYAEDINRIQEIKAELPAIGVIKGRGGDSSFSLPNFHFISYKAS